MKVPSNINKAIALACFLTAASVSAFATVPLLTKAARADNPNFPPSGSLYEVGDGYLYTREEHLLYTGNAKKYCGLNITGIRVLAFSEGEEGGARLGLYQDGVLIASGLVIAFKYFPNKMKELTLVPRRDKNELCTETQRLELKNEGGGRIKIMKIYSDYENGSDD